MAKYKKYRKESESDIIPKQNLNINGYVITEDINNKFANAFYGTFPVVVMKSNGYINATRFCKMYGKKFINWIENKSSQKVIDMLCNRLDKSESQIIIDIIQNEPTDGTYIYPKLMLHIIIWCDPIFSLDLSNSIIHFNKKDGQINEQKQIIETLNQNNDILLAKNKKISQKNTELQDTIDEISSTNDKILVKNSKLTNTVEKLTDRIEKLLEKNTKLSDSVEKLSEKNTKLTDCIGKLSGQVNKLSDTNDVLSVQCQNLKLENEQLHTDITDLKILTNKLVPRVQKLETKNSELQDIMQNNTAEIEMLKKKISKMKSVNLQKAKTRK